MAIQIPFDNTGNPIAPTFVLATKSGRKLGAIPASNIHIADNFNSYFDLCFKVYKYNNGTECNLWDDIKDFRLVWCPEWDVWFEIYVELNETNDMIKNISAKSVGEAELSQINLYDIHINTEEDISQPDYTPTVLYDVLNPRGSLLHRILEKAPHYSVTSVDSSIARIQRTFTFDSKSIYDALQEIGQEINCIFIIDSGTDLVTGNIKREIIVKDLESHCTNTECGVYRTDEFTSTCPKCGAIMVPGYGENTSIFISTDNLADNINYSTNTDAVKNCFKLEAGDDLMTATIVNCNPNGSSYIWHIPADLKSDMSVSLQSALRSYEDTYTSYQTKSIGIGSVNTYNTNIVAKYNALKTYDTFNFNNLTSLSPFVNGYPNLMVAYYDTVDAKLLLESGLMPSPNIANNENKTEIQLVTGKIYDTINSLLGSGIALVSDIINQSESVLSYVNNAIKSFLGSFLTSSFGIEISESWYDTSTKLWKGLLKIFDRSNDSSCFINIGNLSSSILNGIPDVLSLGSISVTTDSSIYRTQMLYKTLNSKNNDETDIVSMFNKSNTLFKEELQKYSLKRLESFHDACQACLNLLIEQGINAATVYNIYTQYYSKLLLLNNEIASRKADIATIETIQDRILSERNTIQQILNFQDYITSYSQDGNLWLELAPYRRDDTYLNSNYISDGLNNVELVQKAQEFYDVAQKEIIKSATLQHSISATLKNLMTMPEFQNIIDYFQVGNWIKIGVDDNIHILRLLSYEIDFDNLDNIFVEFSDVKKTKNGLSDIDSVLTQAASMTTSYGAVAHQASQGQKGNQKLDSWVSDGLALTQMKILNNAQNQNIVWDDGGVLCRRYNDLTEQYENEQLKIINSTIAFTTDNWRNIKTAIGKFLYLDTLTNTFKYGYGVNAETIIGELIMGQNLMIRNSGSTFKVTNDGIDVSNTWTKNSTQKHISFTVNPNATSVVSLTAWEDYNYGYGTGKQIFYIDDNGHVFFAGSLSAATGTFAGSLSAATGSFSGTITATGGKIGGWTIGANTLSYNKGTTYNSATELINANDKFIVNTDGSITATGTITATGGKIGGWTIGANTLSYNKGTTYNSATELINANGNFIVNTSGYITATGAVLKGDNASFEFSSSTDVKLGWLGSWFSHTTVPVAILSGASYAVSRNVITGANIDKYGNLSVDDYAPGAGLVHCGTVTDTSGGYGFSYETSLKARFGLNSKGEAFIQITPLNNESTAHATFHFTPDGYIKITSNGRSTTL